MKYLYRFLFFFHHLSYLQQISLLASSLTQFYKCVYVYSKPCLTLEPCHSLLALLRA